MLKTILYLCIFSSIGLYWAVEKADFSNEDSTMAVEMTECDSIFRALDYHTANHPYSHYKDIYKSFMQDIPKLQVLLDMAKPRLEKVRASFYIIPHVIYKKGCLILIHPQLDMDYWQQEC